MPVAASASHPDGRGAAARPGVKGNHGAAALLERPHSAASDKPWLNIVGGGGFGKLELVVWKFEAFP